MDNRFPTGFQLKSKELGGKDPRVEYFRKGSAASHLSVADFNPDYFGAARHLHLSGVAAALSDTSLALSKFAASEMRKAGKLSRLIRICARCCGAASSKCVKKLTH
ncbi:Uncharacterised protein [Ewingella americana]|uniref:Uncharacterized protein n=1 Tax=Ewingella americana TaxID=41202 RepID=A0A377N6D7_9GAMM|nr:Uncharacterised protein [Ewingella americana]